ncbi:MAG: imidazole glycerol phosphate synthase subunit HisF [Candidatus Melainabacteria bacterium]|nr:MAG: imidazole glycerol phosphate synthase subunit HisF [Candidatus Melainabacteria bacterium]
MLTKRIIPCLDVRDGRTVKGVNFTNLRDMGCPVELGLMYESQGADELMFLDITASVEGRAAMLEFVERVADNLSIPFTVGGGVSSRGNVTELLNAGADKVSMNTAAVKRPELINEVSTQFGSQCCVVAIDARKKENGNDNLDNGGKIEWEVLIKGGRESVGLDALEWAEECVRRGAGEILLTSWNRDGMQTGFDIEMVKAFSERLPIPVIASGGAANPESFVEVFEKAGADAALAASIFHDKIYSIGDVKLAVKNAGISVRE